MKSAKLKSILEDNNIYCDIEDFISAMEDVMFEEEQYVKEHEPYAVRHIAICSEAQMIIRNLIDSE